MGIWRSVSFYLLVDCYRSVVELWESHEMTNRTVRGEMLQMESMSTDFRWKVMGCTSQDCDCNNVLTFRKSIFEEGFFRMFCRSVA